MNTKVTELARLEKGASYVAVLNVNDGMVESNIEIIQSIAKEAGCKIAILLTEDMGNIRFISKVTETYE